MSDRGTGSIINTSSIIAERGSAALHSGSERCKVFGEVSDGATGRGCRVRSSRAGPSSGSSPRVEGEAGLVTRTASRGTGSGEALLGFVQVEVPGRQDLVPVGGHRDGVLVLRGEPAVSGHDGPPVVEEPDVGRP